MLSFADIEDKVAVRFEVEKGQDAIHEITLCKYLENPQKMSCP